MAKDNKKVTSCLTSYIWYFLNGLKKIVGSNFAKEFSDVDSLNMNIFNKVILILY